MRFYSFDPIDLAATGDLKKHPEATPSSLYLPSAHCDFTSSSIPSGLDHLVLNQVPKTLINTVPLSYIGPVQLCQVFTG